MALAQLGSAEDPWLGNRHSHWGMYYLKTEISLAIQLTFQSAHLALAAVEKLCKNWKIFIQNNHIPCGLGIGVAQGDLYIFRSYIYGKGLNGALRLEYISSLVCPSKDKNLAVVSQRIKDEVGGTIWENRVRKIEQVVTSDKSLHKIPQKLLNENEIYQFMIT